jgi:hypothetical protein
VFRRDRSGIVAAVTGVLADDSGNVEDTSMTSGARRCVLDHRAHVERIAWPADLRCASARDTEHGRTT